MDNDFSQRIDGDLRTRSLAELIHEVTEPPGGETPLALLITKPEAHFAIGLLQGCRNFLLGGCDLFDADRESAIPPLARSAMEFSVTGMWLLRNPAHHVKRFLRAQLHEADLLGATDPDEANQRREGVLKAFGRLIPEEERTGKKLPSFKNRLGREMGNLYSHYRFLSEEVHPSFVASSLAYKVNLHEEEVRGVDRNDVEMEATIAYDVSGRGESGDYLFFIAEFTWLLAADLQKHLGRGFPPALEAAGHVLWVSRSDEEAFLEIMRRLDGSNKLGGP